MRNRTGFIASLAIIAAATLFSIALASCSGGAGEHPYTPHSVPVIISVTVPSFAGQGEVATFHVVAKATAGGTLTYNWDVGFPATIQTGQGTDTVTVLFAFSGNLKGTVYVTENIDGFASVTAFSHFEVWIGHIHPPIFDAALSVAPTPPATGPFTISANFYDVNGDDIIVTWSTDVGDIVPGASDNTSATATFTHLDEDGTAIVTCRISAVFNPDVYSDASTTIDFMFDPWAGAVSDSILLRAEWMGALPLDLDSNPATPAVDTDVIQLHIYGWTAVGKPLAALDAVRVSMLKTDAAVFSASPGSYFLDNATRDIFRTTRAQSDAYFDMSIVFTDNKFEIVDWRGILAVVTLVPPEAMSGGAATFTSGATIAFDIIDQDGSEFGRTYYTDLSSPPIKHHFATLGKDYGAGVTSAFSFVVP